LIRNQSKAGETSQNLDENLDETAKSYKVISRFRDQNNESKIYELNEVVPADFEESRISSLLERKLISEA